LLCGNLVQAWILLPKSSAGICDPKSDARLLLDVDLNAKMRDSLTSVKYLLSERAPRVPGLGKTGVGPLYLSKACRA
jgi:hypothetical protein